LNAGEGLIAKGSTPFPKFAGSGVEDFRRSHEYGVLTGALKRIDKLNLPDGVNQRQKIMDRLFTLANKYGLAEVK